MKLNRFFRPRSQRATQSIIRSAVPSRPAAIKPVIEPLEDRQLMSLTIDLRVAGTEGKTASVTSVGQVIHLEAWATISGNTSGANDGLQSVCGSFLSAATSSSSVAGNLGNQNVTGDYTALGASLGTEQDLNSDGNLDVGSNKNSDIAGFFNARSGGVAQDGTVSGNTQSLEFGTIDYTVTSMHSGSATNVNFRLRNGVPSGAFDAVWLQDNAGQNDQIGSVIIGAPVVIKNPNATSPTGAISGAVNKVVNGSTSADAGITVYLDNNNDGVLDSGDVSTTTSSSGTYSFGSLAAGTYHLREVVPSGFTQTSPSSSPTNVNVGTSTVSGENFTLTAASTTTSGLLTGSIIGTPGSYQNKGNTIAKAFDGNFSTYYDAAGGIGNWAGLNLGSQFKITKVSYAPRANYASRMVGGIFQGSNTADFSSGVVNLATITSAPASGTFTSINISNSNSFEFVRYLSPNISNGNVAELQFYGTNGTVVVGTASIAGTVSKIVSGATSGLSGVTVYLDNNNDGVLDSGDTSTITNSAGTYSFTNLVAGTYHVREVTPSGYSQTSPGSSPTNVTLATGQASSGNNFTDTASATTGPITLSGNVFRDLNSNKVKDSGEAGLSGWVVYVDLNHDGKFESNENNKTTDANGNFTFVSLKAGTYNIRVVQKSGFTLTTPASGFYTVTLNPGVPVSVSFGEH